MRWLKNLFEHSEQRLQRLEKKRIQQLADSVWKNRGSWPLMTVTKTKMPWLATGDGFDQARFNHSSAYSALNRYPVVDLLVERLAAEAYVCMEGNSGVLHEWCYIEHDAFWKELTAVFSGRARIAHENARVGVLLLEVETPWNDILSVAGLCGNLAPFRFCPRDELVLYMSQASMCHPKVGLWLHQQGLCSMNDLRTFVNESTMPMVKESWRSFAGSLVGEPIAPEYVANWCNLLLSEYELPTDSKVRVVAHVVYAFGIDAWKAYVLPACAPYLEGIELPLVYAVCSINMATLDPANSAWRLLQTVVDLSQEEHKDYDTQLATTINEESRHAHLAMLCELAPPQSRLELYFLAYNALQIDKNAAPSIDVLELPELA